MPTPKQVSIRRRILSCPCPDGDAQPLHLSSTNSGRADHRRRARLDHETGVEASPSAQFVLKDLVRRCRAAQISRIKKTATLVEGDVYPAHAQLDLYHRC